MSNNERRDKSTCELAALIMFISGLIIIAGVLLYHLSNTAEVHSGKFAFVLGAERAPSVVDALNNSGGFNAVFRVDDSQMLSRLCGDLEKSTYTPYPEYIRNACASKAVVVVTDGGFGAAVVFLGSEGEITQRVIEILTFERFDGGYIDIYDNDKQLGYVRGYEHLLLGWNPVDAGKTIDAIVERYESEIITSKKVLDTAANYTLYAGVAVAGVTALLIIFKCIIPAKKPS